MKTLSPIIGAMVTEKSSVAQSKGKYTFVVNKNSTKIDIKNEIKKLYGADVESVNIMVTPKKIRILKGKYEWNKRPSYKKAIITLKGKKTIDPNKLKETK